MPVIPEDQEGNGKVGEDEIDDEIIAQYQAKKEEDDQKNFPELQGPHQKYVKHPSAIFPKWASFSKPLKVKWYAKYLQYVDNWKNGKNGIAMKKFSGFNPVYQWTDEDEALLNAEPPGFGKSNKTAVCSKTINAS